jgi:NAD(P)-dependent dehydrogenase (short-subunit alcohol dehydrogenase family)
MTSTSSRQSTVFITGGASGIGRATAVLFAGHGYRVGGYDVNMAGLEALEKEVTESGGDVVVGRLDVTDADEWAAQLDAFTDKGRLDILVNNAGVLSAGRFEEMPLKDHRRMVDINVYGALVGLHAAFPHLHRTPGAQVVNMCSASAVYGQPELATYSATKFALRALTEALDLEWRTYGIRVLSMWPLFVQTAMIEGVDSGSTRSLGVHLSAQDVADAVYAATRARRRLLHKVHYPVGRRTKILAAAAQVTPAWANRLMNKAVTGT